MSRPQLPSKAESNFSVERMRAEHVTYRFERCGPPASLSFFVRHNTMSRRSCPRGRWRRINFCAR